MKNGQGELYKGKVPPTTKPFEKDIALRSQLAQCYPMVLRPGVAFMFPWSAVSLWYEASLQQLTNPPTNHSQAKKPNKRSWAENNSGGQSSCLSFYDGGQTS